LSLLDDLLLLLDVLVELLLVLLCCLSLFGLELLETDSRNSKVLRGLLCPPLCLVQHLVVNPDNVVLITLQALNITLVSELTNPLEFLRGRGNGKCVLRTMKCSSGPVGSSPGSRTNSASQTGGKTVRNGHSEVRTRLT